jgi:hypothetical protein
MLQGVTPQTQSVVLTTLQSNSRAVFSSKVLPSAHFYVTSPGRLDAGVLLIDFDMNEVQETRNKSMISSRAKGTAVSGYALEIADAVSTEA